MKKFFGEFKKFITRGNILDLAVGVIIGGAFTAIVTSLTNNIIRPLINWIIALVGGKEGLSAVYTFLSKTYTVDEAGNTIIDLKNSIYIDWGLFLTAIIDFFIIAFVVFLIIKAVNKARETLEELNERLEAQTKKEYIAERKAVKAKAKAEGRKFKLVWKEHLEEKKRMAEEKAKFDAEEKARKEAEEKLNNPTEQELLKQIRDLLIENKKLKNEKKDA
jgi:large conductance mechanosensitive channel